MRIGLLAFSTDTGLGNQTQAFYKYMKPVKTLVVDLSQYNGMEQHPDRFENANFVYGIPDCNAMNWLASDVDLTFVAETPLNYCLFEKTKERGIKTVLQYNYEFLDYLQNNRYAAPDVLAAPTWWHKNDVEKLGIAPVVDLFMPVDDERIRPREISLCRKIIHVAGKQAIHDRNGTQTFIRAAMKCADKFQYVIYAQDLDEGTRRLLAKAQKVVNIELIENVPEYEDMYASGDVMVLPRKYGGLCLPMQEALAAGMPVIMPDVSPNEQRLPKQWLVKADRRGSFTARTEIDIYETDADHLAFKMCQFGDAEFMQWSNQEAIRLGKELSWKNATAHYKAMFEQILA